MSIDDVLIEGRVPPEDLIKELLSDRDRMLDELHAERKAHKEDVARLEARIKELERAIELGKCLVKCLDEHEREGVEA